MPAQPLPQPSPSMVSRRRLLAVGLAAPAASALSFGALGAPAAAAALPLVRPISSDVAHRSFGVCAHVNMGGSGYVYTEAMLTQLASLNVPYFRSMYVPQIKVNVTAISVARRLGLKWGMLIVPDLSLSDDEIRAKVAHIAANAADLCLYVEGVNEPNYTRNVGPVPADKWRARTVAKQKVLWDAVRSHPQLAHVKVLGPSLQMIVLTEGDVVALRDLGICNYMDTVGLHSYTGGRYPATKLDERVALFKKYWTGKGVWITETGYTNAMSTNSGHRPAPEDVVATYAPITLLEHVDRGYQVGWYELLDDLDAGAKDDIESNFGLLATQGTTYGPPWRVKPAASTLRGFLGELADPGAAYDPAPVPLRLTPGVADVKATVLGRRDGTARVYLRRNVECWDARYQRRVDVPAVPVLVESATGVRTVQVGAQVVSVRL